MIRHLRAWLKINKIFFETVAALALSVMAILLSYSQLSVYKMQTAILEQTVLPHFIITARSVKTSNANFVDEDVIIVENTGAPVTGFNVTPIVLFGLPDKSISHRVSVNNYYGSNTEIHSGNGTGVLAKIHGHKNNKQLITLQKSLRARNLGVIVIDRYLNVQYWDRLGRLHEEYYYVVMTYGARRIPDNEGRAVFARWRSDIHKMKFIEFSEVSVEKVLKAFDVEASQQLRPSDIR